MFVVGCLLCVLPTFTLMSNPAFAAPAYTIVGWWTDQPSSGCCAHFSPTQGSAYSDDVNDWNNALLAWNQSAANVVAYINPGNPDPRMNLYDFNCSSCDPGVTYITLTGSAITHTDAYINHYFTGSNAPSYGQSVAAHEFGHVMGLGHNPNNLCVLMYPTDDSYWKCNVTGPTWDEVNGINSLY